jgi:hypothetical protein
MHYSQKYISGRPAGLPVNGLDHAAVDRDDKRKHFNIQTGACQMSYAKMSIQNLVLPPSNSIKIDH